MKYCNQNVSYLFAIAFLRYLRSKQFVRQFKMSLPSISKGKQSNDFNAPSLMQIILWLFLVFFYLYGLPHPSSSLLTRHCVKSVSIRSYSDPHFPAFRLNTERYGVSLRIQSEYGKMGTRITANSDTFQALVSPNLLPSMLVFFLLNHIHSDEKFTIGRYTFTVSLGKKKRKKK